MSRVPEKLLHARVESVNAREGRPAVGWVREGDRNIGQVGHVSLGGALGYWNVEEMVNTSGGVSVLFTGTTRREVLAYLDGRLAGHRAAVDGWRR